MTAVGALHPAIQYHLVNSLGWRQLRATQEQAIEPISKGYHALILAPTAGGKTEAALLPVMSRMLTEKWDGLSVLYVCPIKALLNNLFPRIEKYLGYIGRRVGLWHGDISESARQGMRAVPPDVLLTTPESIEAMLISRKMDHKTFFANLNVVIIDELHAFAGDDRGWHLLMLLERLSRLSGHPIQRLGLSATIGNTEFLLEWLARDLPPGRVLIGGGEAKNVDADVTIDHVGTLENAAYVLSRLYRGEKRLVFADSRSKVETLAVGLRERGVRTFVSHSSLSQEERRQAEAEFASGSDCAIVATSTLELGLDVGDLDRVIQIDAPSTVAAFLQRMGRTGRRDGTLRNCLFLTTTEESFLFAAGIVRLWLDGYVESITPPPSPWHLVAQQIMALCLQEGGVSRQDWHRWLGSLPLFKSLEIATFEEIVKFMREQHILEEEDGILWFGTNGERLFGRRHFSDVVTSFTTPMLIDVRYGKTELGQVDPVTLRTRSEQPPTFVLGGRPWKVKHIDWASRHCWVEPAGHSGQSRWLGSTRAANFELCRSVHRIITDDLPQENLSKRGASTFSRIRENFEWCRPNSTTLVRANGDITTWWTFAGSRANALLATGLDALGFSVANSDNFGIRFHVGQLESLTKAIRSFPDPTSIHVPIPERLISELKFNECLQQHLLDSILSSRQTDINGADRILAMDIHSIVDAS